MEGGKRSWVKLGILLGTTDARTHLPPPRTDGGAGDSDSGDKQRGEIWGQEEAGSQNKSGGSRGMEDRMKLTDIKTARTHRESSPFLIARIQRLAGAGERAGERAGLAGGGRIFKLHEKVELL